MPDFTDNDRERITDNRVAIAEIRTWRPIVDKKLDEILAEVRKPNGDGGFTLRGVDTKWVIIGLLVWLAPDAAAYFLSP